MYIQIEEDNFEWPGLNYFIAVYLKLLKRHELQIHSHKKNTTTTKNNNQKTITTTKNNNNILGMNIISSSNGQHLTRQGKPHPLPISLGERVPSDSVGTFWAGRITGDPLGV